jgi:hypothetical protein
MDIAKHTSHHRSKVLLSRRRRGMVEKKESFDEKGNRKQKEEIGI